MDTEPDRNLPLQGLTVAVVGAGRIGSELIRNLAAMGSRRIDVFERLPRAATALRSHHTVYGGDFWDTLTLARLQQYDFAVCTVDSPAARRRMNQKCLVANTNLVQVWTEGTLAIVGAFPFAAQPEAACFECNPSRAASPTPLATLKLAAAERPGTAAPATRVATVSIAGTLAASVIARIAAGSHGAVARRATLDAGSGRGASLEIQRDLLCERCHDLQRPLSIVHTRNRWVVPASVAETCPEMLNQRLQLSDEIEGLPVESCNVRELTARFHGGPIPAKFALATVNGRVYCLDFEDCESGAAPDAPLAAADGT